MYKMKQFIDLTKYSKSGKSQIALNGAFIEIKKFRLKMGAISSANIHSISFHTFIVVLEFNCLGGEFSTISFDKPNILDDVDFLKCYKEFECVYNQLKNGSVMCILFLVLGWNFNTKLQQKTYQIGKHLSWPVNMHLRLSDIGCMANLFQQQQLDAIPPGFHA